MLGRCQHQPSPGSSTLTGMMSVNRTYLPPAPDSSFSNESAPITVAYNLAYSIENPRLLSHSYRKKPLIILHGGPGIPSDYLHPISTHFKDRAVIFYDQLGCGKSSEPSDIKAYYIQNSVNDLEGLIRHLNIRSFHLLGHSFGGIIPYELVKRGLEISSQSDDPDIATDTLQNLSKSQSHKCLSLTLSSTPFNVQQAEEESEKLQKTLDGHLSTSETQEDISESASFQQVHVCRTTDTPRPLQEALSKRGKVWFGTEVIQDYVAEEPKIVNDAAIDGKTSTCPNMPTIFLTRGEFDFASALHSQENWKELFDHASFGSACCKTYTLAGCAHYGMLEDGAQYARSLESFLSDCDSKEDQCQRQ